jgi:transposase
VHPAALRYDVIRAREAGLDAAAIQRLTGVPARSQRRIVHEEVPFGMADTELREHRRVGRPSVLQAPFPEIITEILAAAPRLSVAEVLRRLRSDHGYTGGKNPVYVYVAAHRPAPPAPLPLVRFEGVAGEFAQHDFGALTVTYLDGRREKLIFYAGRLKYSRALHVSLTGDETTEAFIRGMEAAARSWGGLPLLNVVDNTKAAVLRRVKDAQSGQERIHYQEQFASFLREVGVFAEPTAPYSGNQKGSVENLVKFAKHSFLLARRFRSREDLERQLAEWLHYVNAERACEATGVIPALRLQEEQARLRPLPFGERGYGLTYPAVVGRDGLVRCRGYGYSTPPGWIGQPVTVRLHPAHLVLHHAGQQVVHPRVPANHRYSLLPEHRAPLFVKPRGALMAKRQILMDLCPEGERFFTELVHRRPQTWREQDLPAAWELFEQVGAERMSAAFRYCLIQQAIGGEYLRAWAHGLVQEAAV